MTLVADARMMWWRTTDRLEAGSPLAQALYSVVSGRRTRVTLHWLRGVTSFGPDELHEVYRELAAIGVQAALAAAPYSVTINAGVPHAADHLEPMVHDIDPTLWCSDDDALWPSYLRVALRQPDFVESPWGLAVRFHRTPSPTIDLEAHMVSKFTAHPDGVPLWLAIAGAPTLVAP